MMGPSVPVGNDYNKDLESKLGTTRSQGSQDERSEVETPHPQPAPPPPAREYDWRDGFLSPCSDYLGQNPRTNHTPSRPVRSASDAEVPTTTTTHVDDPPTNDLDILSKRLANVGLMDSLCPLDPAAPTDERWATQVHSLLTHLANKVDAEIEAQSFARRRKALHRSNSMANVGQGGASQCGNGLTGVYENMLQDWVQRLQQVPLEVIRLHPGLKRELDKIRWQYGSLARA
ncbi:hypothetical protein BGZ82_009279 [Podila clonocystis]|nr:hypothetical protein BGZ82_009279 [Podila clonocystis]